MRDQWRAPERNRRGDGRPTMTGAGAGRGIVSIVVAASLSCVFSAAHAETLADAVAQAYRTNPTLAGARAQLRVSDETLVQAQEEYRPTATVSGGATHQDITSERYFSYQTATVSVSQPVFTGGRVGSRITAAQADLLSGREELQRVESTVLLNVIQAYVDVRRDQQAIVVRQDNVRTLEQEVEESRARFAGGAITRTDVAQSQAGLSAARVQLAQAEGQLTVSQAAYAAVVGQPPQDLAAEPPLNGVPANLNQALEAGEASNPSLRGAKYAEQASHARVAEARAERLPSASITASLGYEPIDALVPRSPYIRNFTAGASVSMPLYQGGSLNSRIRQALDRNNADEIAIEGARRTMIHDLAQAWSQMLVAQREIAEDHEQIEAAKIAFEGAQEEQRVGARTTLEVLTAQQNLAAAELSLITAGHDLYTAQAAILSLTGALKVDALAPAAPRYDPQKNLDRVSPRLWITPWTVIPEALDKGVSPVLDIPKPAKITEAGR